jgi:hypothetical protein
MNCADANEIHIAEGYRSDEVKILLPSSCVRRNYSVLHLLLRLGRQNELKPVPDLPAEDHLYEVHGSAMFCEQT